ncbi:hypothetical protein LK463_11835 [Corynebacterium diphtheriae]|nr:hypothetical protein [Corynebacterium diphtheriae]UEB75804.1 hypothetical protein LK463_11835 [Corynebacterium diphtheriae]
MRINSSHADGGSYPAADGHNDGEEGEYPEGAVLWGGVVVLISGLRSSATMMSASVLTMT